MVARAASTPRRRLAVTLAATIAIFGASTGWADDQSQYKVADGIDVYYGIVPAAIVRGHSKAHPEGSMHGGPQGNEVHLVVALFDAATSARIENAKVGARILPLGAGGPTRSLQIMPIAGAVSYGEFFPLAPGDRYEIHLKIQRPGTDRVSVVDFVYDYRQR